MAAQRPGLTQALGCMHVDPGQAIFAIRALAVILILSSIYPASRLLKSRRLPARLAVLAVSILSLTSPALLVVAARLRTDSSNDVRVLQQMNILHSSLPALYLISVSAAAIILWLVWLATRRSAA